jgi:hypothetical protein
VDILIRLQTAERQISVANVKLSHRADSRHIQSIEQALYAHREQIPQHPAWSMVAGTVLPDPVTPRKYMWPRAEENV